MTYKKQTEQVIGLYRFFSEPTSALRYLITNSRAYADFYSEYIRSLKPLSTEQFFLFLSECDYQTIALAFQGIYNRCTQPGDEQKLVIEYMEELTSVRSLQLWMNNFEYSDVERVMFDFPEFGKTFHSKTSKGEVLEKVVHAHDFFVIFLQSDDKIKDSLMGTALKLYEKEARENIMFNLEFLSEQNET